MQPDPKYVEHTGKREPNAYVNPFARLTLYNLVRHWLNQTEFVDGGPKNSEIPFDENDSYSWTIEAMKDILHQLDENHNW